MSAEDAILKRKFEALFREFFTELAYFARKYTGGIDPAKEIVHSVFVRIWENRNNFEWDKPARSYLFTSVYHRCMNYIRDNRRFMHGESFLEQFEDESPGVYIVSFNQSELEKRIDAALSKLPEKCREIFELSRFSEKKYSEISNLLNISVKTVEAQMSKALRILKEELKDYLGLLFLLMIKNIINW